MIELSSDEKRDVLEKFLESENRFFSETELKRLTGLSGIRNIGYLPYDIRAQFVTIQLWDLDINANGKKFPKTIREILFCNKIFFMNLVCNIVEEILDRKKQPESLDYLTILIHDNIAFYLGLESIAIGRAPSPNLILNILNACKDKFVIISQSKYEKIDDHKVSLVSWDTASVRPEAMKLRMIQILRENPSIATEKLLFKLNLLHNDFGFPKPYGIKIFDYLNNPTNELFKIQNETITLVPIEERIALTNRHAVRLSSFTLAEEVSGLLIFYFVGNKFLISEANEYVALRNGVFFYPIKNVRNWEDEVLKTQTSELMRILIAFEIPEPQMWAEDNLAVSFILEDFNYLKLNYDKLMQDNSPVFNLDKNPGNLFRGIIEEKIREHASGKQQ